ncbi:Eco57I restriction-modification methylase domain-containing protein [Petrotoga sp. 9PWA.NaAc.5.4]|uniref:Eco57I restriction-modification methylase domain-containing protein n=1 Tax=Petrotoga sp. 9PWA.NaAc.5.4 TaxID=1434328 RepID=UPI000CC3B1FD|nr:Eco57I restriction-modification methylase domain-containing protein [Petrotoga sp. 9PWA.NaAc.5.4]PNR96814.1 hypothetical protein X924_01770 [Petrotoga sp. 9PWA.NaAc.5.4]
MNNSVKKMILDLKNLINQYITNDQDLSLQVMLSLVFIKILEVKGLTKDSQKIFNNQNSMQNLLNIFFSRICFLNETLGYFYNIMEIEGKISCEFIEEASKILNTVQTEDWKKEEIIAWSYEHYNHDSKNNSEVTSQFYTPDWIVEYLIENTFVKHYANNTNFDIETIKIIDPACGCGNFIIALYDSLKEAYLNRGYSSKKACQNIISKNLYGVDKDSKAAEITRKILKLKILEDGVREPIEPNIAIVFKQNSDIGLLEKLEVLGSLITKKDLTLIKDLRLEDKDLIKLIEILSLKYDIVLTNPPYIDSSDYDEQLKKYIDQDYKKFRKNLYACFIIKSYELLKNEGFVGMITPQTFMFISSYEKTRKFIIDNFNIDKLVHFDLGGVFEEALIDTAMFVLKKTSGEDFGEFIDLTSFKRKDSKKHALMEIWKKRNQEYISRYVYHVDKNRFLKVPRYPFIYWISDEILSIFEYKPLNKFADVRQGIATGDNKKFLRYFWEVKRDDISFNYNEDHKKWVPYAKGGPYNKWYGNLWWVIAFDEENYNLLNNMGNNLPNKKYYFKKGITYTMTTSKGSTFRYLPENFLFDCKGSSIFFKNDALIFRFLGILNNSLFSYLERFIAGSVDLEVGDLKKLPIPESIFKKSVETKNLEILSKLNITIKKQNTEIYPTEWHFNKDLIKNVSKFSEFVYTKNALDTYLLLSEGLIDILILKLYNLNVKNFQEIYSSEKVPWAFYPIVDKKDFNFLPSLVSLIKEDFLIEMALSSEDIKYIEKVLKDFYSEKMSIIQVQFNQNNKNNQRQHKKAYLNNIENMCEETSCNPISVFKEFHNDDKLSKELAILKIDYEIQHYLLNSSKGFIPMGFDKNNEEHFLYSLFKEEEISLIENLLHMNLREYIIKEYLENHEKLYKNVPLVWKIGLRNCCFFIHFHNLTEITKMNILEFLKNHKTFKNKKEVLTTISSKNFDINIEDGVLKNKKKFFKNL